MTLEIPRHHVRQTICSTRPAYREGRHPKAVKVYTINNESRYLLIQGVPSVGTSQELIKLCTSYGEVEQHYALDEYPTEDKYTEVYLIKYRKIQNARFAKRKLDDYSFFGGTLHVCYAPEHETVEETREKLQERRRIIAIKIRQNASDSGSGNTTSSQTLEKKRLSVEEKRQESVNDQDQRSLKEDRTLVFDNHQNLSYKSNVQPAQSSLLSTVNPDIAPTVSNDENVQEFNFDLPLPPKETQHFPTPPKKRKQESSRVPSAHATLSPDFIQQSTKPSELRVNPGSQITSKSTAESQNSSEKRAVSSSDIVIRNYKPLKPVPRFVPRQAMKRQTEDSSLVTKDSSQTADSTLNDEIRRQAFHLGAMQGPANLPENKVDRPNVSAAALSSVNETIQDIRSKISKVISDGVMKPS